MAASTLGIPVVNFGAGADGSTFCKEGLSDFPALTGLKDGLNLGGTARFRPIGRGLIFLCLVIHVACQTGIAK